MISDSFWSDPQLAHCTSENLFTNLLFLTSRDSNVIGVYRTMWRSIGAGIGWTEAQLLSAARDLAQKGIVAIDEPTGWVWVKNWWDHNSLRAAFLGNVARKARAELSQVPDQWRDAVQEWIASHDDDGIFRPLHSPLEGASEGLAVDQQGSGGNPTHILTPISTSTNNSGGGGEQISVDSLVTAAVWAASKNGVINNEVGYRYAVRSRIQKNGASAEDLQTHTAWRTEMEKARSEHASHLLAAAQTEARKLEQNSEQERIRSGFRALDASRQEEVLVAFEEYTAMKNPSVHKLLKKQGLKGPLVNTAFVDFLKTSPDLLSKEVRAL